MTKQDVVSLWTKGELDHYAFLLYSYIYLKGRTQENLHAIAVSSDCLKKFLGISFSKLQKAILTLEELKILKVEKGHSNQATNYTLLLEQVYSPTEARSPTEVHSPTALRRGSALQPINIKYNNIKKLNPSLIIDKNKFHDEL